MKTKEPLSGDIKLEKVKLYISKSKSGNFDELVRIKNYLSNYDIEVCEFIGGKYTFDILDSCNQLLIVPPNEDGLVGKGQYVECERFIDDVYKDSPMCFLGFNKEGRLEISYIFTTYIIDNNWQTEYADLDLIDNDKFYFDILFEDYLKVDSPKIGSSVFDSDWML